MPAPRSSPLRIGITAPSSKVPSVEFELGLEQLRSAGFDLKVHSQVKKEHWFFAGTDVQRSQAFFEYASSPEVDVLWCARGGYGALRLLSHLDELTRTRGAPPRGKLLVGYSDATALMEYARTRWNWHTLHGPMPGTRSFCMLDPETEWNPLLSWARGEPVTKLPWADKQLGFVGGRTPRSAIEAPLIGGNLTVWNTMVGTPHAPRAEGKIVFLEDIDEALYRIDRMLQHVYQAGGLEGAQALVLGNFQGCEDNVSRVLSKMPSPAERDRVVRAPAAGEMELLREKLPSEKMIQEIFGEIGERLGIPVAYALPVGHGPEHAPLPLGADYRLGIDGTLELVRWDWLRP